jgi:hypothetical protein
MGDMVDNLKVPDELLKDPKLAATRAQIEKERAEAPQDNNEVGRLVGPPSDRGWRVVLYELLPLQLGPETRRNRRLHRGYVGEDLVFAARTYDQCRSDIGGCGET